MLARIRSTCVKFLLSCAHVSLLLTSRTGGVTFRQSVKSYVVLDAVVVCLFRKLAAVVTARVTARFMVTAGVSTV